VAVDKPSARAGTDAEELATGADDADDRACALAKGIAGADAGRRGRCGRTRRNAIRAGFQADVDREATATQPCGARDAWR